MKVPRFTRCLIGTALIAMLAACSGSTPGVDAVPDDAGGGNATPGATPGPVTEPGIATAPGVGERVNQPLDVPVGPAPVEPVRMPAAAGNDDFRPSGYDILLLADEFDGNALDRSKWCTRLPWGGGTILETPDATCTRWLGQGFGDYANVTENQRFRERDPDGEILHAVGGGTIRLRATRSFDHQRTRYAAAALRSKAVFKPTASRSYYVTARVRMPSVLGTWPAFFLIPSLEPRGTNQWPPEIDIFEGALNGQGDTIATVTQHGQVRGAQTDSAVPEWTYLAPGFNPTWGTYSAPTSLRERWLEIGAEWALEGVCYFIDGLKTACENYRWVDNDGQPGNPASLIAYLAIGGPWAGSGGIDDSRMPTEFEIDHIRIYEGDGRFITSAGPAVLATTPAPQGGVAPPSSIPPDDPDDDHEPVGFTLIFDESFNGEQLDRTQWCTRLAGRGGAPLQIADAQCVDPIGAGSADHGGDGERQRFRDLNSVGQPLHELSAGSLRLLATRTGADPAAPWESGALRSKLSIVPAYLKSFYVTARVRLPDVPGIRAVFSILPEANDDGSLPPTPTASVFDAVVGTGPDSAATLRHQSIVDGRQTSTGQRQHSFAGPGFDPASGRFTAAESLRGRWLEVGVEWTDGHLCWFINGVPSACENYFWVSADGSPGNFANLNLYLAVDAANQPTVDSAQMLVDRIRVFQRIGN